MENKRKQNKRDFGKGGRSRGGRSRGGYLRKYFKWRMAKRKRSLIIGKVFLIFQLLIKSMNGIKKKNLEILLERIPSHPNPDPSLEQYATPAPIAADILFTAYIQGDILNKKIIDLGCGTGIFAIGAALIGADIIVGIDIDKKSLDIARQIAEDLGVHEKISF